MGALVAIVLGGICLAPPTPEDVRTVTRRVYQDARWQKDLPPVLGERSPTSESGEGGAGSGRSGGSGERSGRGDPGSPRRPGDPHSRSTPESGPRRPPPRPSSETDPADLPEPPSSPPSFPGWLGHLLAWAGVITIVALVVFGLLALWRSRSQAPPPAPAAKDPETEGGGAPAFPRGRVPGLDEADALAAKGLYAEAIHLLLARAFGVLQSAGKADSATSSLTSREVLSRSRLANDLRDALTHLVASVEVSHFGGVPVDEREWRESRNRYERVATATPTGRA